MKRARSRDGGRRRRENAGAPVRQRAVRHAPRRFGPVRGRARGGATARDAAPWPRRSEARRRAWPDASREASSRTMGRCRVAWRRARAARTAMGVPACTIGDLGSLKGWRAPAAAGGPPPRARSRETSVRTSSTRPLPACGHCRVCGERGQPCRDNAPGTETRPSRQGCPRSPQTLGKLTARVFHSDAQVRRRRILHLPSLLLRAELGR